MGPGCEQLAYVAANPQTPPSRPHHREDPPVLPSVKGSPFTDGRTGGRPPGDGFCPSSGWVVSGQEAGPRRRKQAPPPHEHPSRATGPPPPPLEISGQVHRVPGLLSELREALPATHRTKRFPPWTTRPSSSPTLAEAECPGRTRDVGPGRGAGKRGRPRFRARWSGSGRADPWSTDRFSRRESGLCPCWEAKSLASPATPPPCHKAADLDPAASTLQSVRNHPKMECDRCDLSPPELEAPPL